MTHYRLTDSTPSAIILARNPRTSSLDELKTYQGNDIFLNNGDEFQIRLFNPLTERIGAQVSINGKGSNHLLVLNPGEDVVVDRFLDEKRRMIFETYQYDDNNQAARNAVANNGIIELKFFKEFFPTVYNSITWNSSAGVTGPCQSIGTNGNYGTLSNTLGIGGVFTSFDASNNNSRIYDSNALYSANLSAPLDFESDCVSKACVDGEVNINLNINTFKNPGVYVCEPDKSEISTKNLMRSKSAKIKETGRVTKGDKSSQSFQSVDIQFESFPFHTIVYHLKPMSEKNEDLREIREYCDQCRYRIRKSSYLYCPKCGNKL